VEGRPASDAANGRSSWNGSAASNALLETRGARTGLRRKGSHLFPRRRAGTIIGSKPSRHTPRTAIPLVQLVPLYAPQAPLPASDEQQGSFSETPRRSLLLRGRRDRALHRSRGCRGRPSRSGRGGCSLVYLTVGQFRRTLSRNQEGALAQIFIEAAAPEPGRSLTVDLRANTTRRERQAGRPCLSWQQPKAVGSIVAGPPVTVQGLISQGMPMTTRSSSQARGATPWSASSANTIGSACTGSTRSAKARLGRGLPLRCARLLAGTEAGEAAALAHQTPNTALP
jgi:hypothetical protein